MKTEIFNWLQIFYEDNMILVGSDAEIKSDLPVEVKELLDQVLAQSEASKGVLAVVITSIVYKIFWPEQDIRNHQSSIPGGYSGRTFDSTTITPFLKKARFPAMAESGWLTRSLEQKVPYDLNYTGAIKPDSLKPAFLNTLAYVEEDKYCNQMLSYLFQGLIIQRNRQIIDLAKPLNLSIRGIADLLEKHFFSAYKSDGASRLPVLALYAVYQCLVQELKRFEGMSMAEIESHTTSDLRSGRIGDIEVVGADGEPFEAVEVKHGIALNVQLVKDAFDKLSKTHANRYYLLSTNEVIAPAEKTKIDAEIERIKNLHGCQVICNGLMRTIYYYLRLLENPAKFIDGYVDLLEQDKSIKFEHKQRWNELNSGASEKDWNY